MAGAMRKVGVYLGLVEDDEHYEEYDDYDDEPELRRPVPVHDEPRASVAAMPERTHERVTERAVSHERRPQAAPAASQLNRITTIHPRAYNDAKTIGEAFRGGTPVIMNLTDMEDSDAKRLVDFAAGLIFGLRGSIERVTNKVFLLSPANVTVTAEDKARIAESGFFNQS